MGTRLRRPRTAPDTSPGSLGSRAETLQVPVPSQVELAAARADIELLRLHAEYCKVVANEHRLAILYALAEEERSVGDLAEELGLTLANVSQHLRVMKARGLVAGRREGRTIHYSVANPKLVAACHLIRQALIEQHLVTEAIILGDEVVRTETEVHKSMSGDRRPHVRTRPPQRVAHADHVSTERHGGEDNGT